MKKIFLSIIIIFSIILVKAQSGEIGPYVGASFYIGEINPSRLFFMPSLVYGVVFRHNLNERISFRIEGSHTNLKGSDTKSNNLYQLERGKSFNSPVTDLATGIEFNFFPYNKKDQQTKYFTPYVFVGASFLVIPENKDAFSFAIPYAFGFKYAVNKKVSLGAEWSIRKTFTDYIDQLDEDYISNLRTTYENKQRSYNPNNDWYSFAGVILTVQLFKSEDSCPAYR